MKIIEILNENANSPNIDLTPYQQNLESLLARISKRWDNSNLARGASIDIREPRIIPQQHTYRAAANTGDLYKKIADAANPSWPQRSKSVITSADFDYASGYGHAHYVVPKDGTVIAAVNRNDFWKLPYLGVNRVADIVRFAPYNSNFLEVFGKEDSEKLSNLAPARFNDEATFVNFMQELKTFVRSRNMYPPADSIFPGSDLEEGVDETLFKILESWWRGPSLDAKTIIPEIIAKLPYERVGVTKVKYADLKSDNGECWFEGDYLALPVIHIDDLKKMLKIE